MIRKISGICPLSIVFAAVFTLPACTDPAEQVISAPISDSTPSAARAGGKIWIRLPSALSDAVRRKRYDEPLAAALAQEGRGRILEGDSVENPDGSVSYVTLIVGLVPGADLAADLSYVQRIMGELGAPYETQYITYAEETAPQ